MKLFERVFKSSKTYYHGSDTKFKTLEARGDYIKDNFYSPSSQIKAADKDADKQIKMIFLATNKKFAEYYGKRKNGKYVYKVKLTRNLNLFDLLDIDDWDNLLSSGIKIPKSLEGYNFLRNDEDYEKWCENYLQENYLKIMNNWEEKMKKNKHWDAERQYLFWKKEYEKTKKKLSRGRAWALKEFGNTYLDIEKPDVLKIVKKLGYDGVVLREGGDENLGIFNAEDVKIIDVEKIQRVNK